MSVVLVGKRVVLLKICWCFGGVCGGGYVGSLIVRGVNFLVSVYLYYLRAKWLFFNGCGVFSTPSNMSLTDNFAYVILVSQGTHKQTPHTGKIVRREPCKCLTCELSVIATTELSHFLSSDFLGIN